MPLTINVPDTLRRAVESASGGRNTVLYTAKGQPCHMVVIPRVTLQSIDASLGTGDHPAFIVGGVSKPEIFLGQHIGCNRNGEMLSVDPINSINHDNAVNLARANGTGWHLMSNAEWALLGLLCWRNGTQPRGNTNFGRSSDLLSERGVDTVTGRLALTTGNATSRTLTGSGPTSWRHDYTPFGIADLNGNVWEWSPGMRINAGEIQVTENNNAALNATDFAAGSAAWRAIDGATGALVTPGTAGTVKYASANSGTADFTLYRTSGQTFEGMANSTGANPVGATAIARLKSLGLFPVAASGLGGDGFYLNTADERLPFRGGRWGDGGLAGVSSLFLSSPRSVALTDVGARPAFVL
jgi:hypothetical protein